MKASNSMQSHLFYDYEPRESTDVDDNAYRLFQFDHFKEYCKSNARWKLSEAGYKLTYLFDAISQGAENQALLNQGFNTVDLNQMLNTLDKLIADCKAAKNPYSIHFDGIFFRAFNAANKLVRQRPLDKKNLWHSIEIVYGLYLAYRLSICPHKLSDLPGSLFESAIKKNDLKKIKMLIPLVDDKTRKQLFRFAVHLDNMAAVCMVLHFEASIGVKENLYSLYKMKRWPIHHANSDATTKEIDLSVSSPPKKTKSISQAILRDFPVDEDNSVFNTLYPYSNEAAYNELIQQLMELSAFRFSGSWQSNEKVNVAILFGESHFLSMLNVLSRCVGVDMVIMADVEPRFFKHIQHMLDCLVKSETIEEYMENYLKDNPILNEKLGPNHYTIMDIHTLRYEIKRSGGTGPYHFLSSTESFNACKNAAKNLEFVLMKLDLTHAGKCEQLADLLTQQQAMLRLCNFTNIHHYGGADKLSLSLPLLLKDSEECFIMFAKGPIDNLSTKLSWGLTEYFDICLRKEYTPRETASGKDERQSESALPGVGFFSPGIQFSSEASSSRIASSPKSSYY